MYWFFRFLLTGETPVRMHDGKWYKSAHDYYSPKPQPPCKFVHALLAQCAIWLAVACVTLALLW